MRLLLLCTEEQAECCFKTEPDISIFTVVLSATLVWTCPTSTHHCDWRINTHTHLTQCHHLYVTEDCWSSQGNHKQVKLEWNYGDKHNWQHWAFLSKMNSKIIAQREHMTSHTPNVPSTYQLRYNSRNNSLFCTAVFKKVCIALRTIFWTHERKGIFSQNIIINVTEQQVWSEKEDQRQMEWWPLVVETRPDEKVKDKVYQSFLLLFPPSSFSTFCLLSTQPRLRLTLCFEANCKPHVLISLVTVAYFNCRYSVLPALQNQQLIRIYDAIVLMMTGKRGKTQRNPFALIC